MQFSNESFICSCGRRTFDLEYRVQKKGKFINHQFLIPPFQQEELLSYKLICKCGRVIYFPKLDKKDTRW